MPEPVIRAGVPDRLRVFISSTIGECAAERQAARKAVVGLNFEPVLFEREGARAEAPRDFYLRKLHDSHVVVGIYRDSYGWIDEAKGMTVSGLEDEFREAQRLGKDLLAYVLRQDGARHERLRAMVEEMKAGLHVLYFFDDGEDLEERIRDDLTALVADRVSQAQSFVSTTRSASTVIRAIFHGSPLRVRRAALLNALTDAASHARITWVVGEAGAGKTALAAEWANERDAAYVPARGSDPRLLLLAAARELGVADEVETATPLFEDARALLTARWSEGRRWPLILDDPDDLDALWPVLSECLRNSGTGSVVVVTRERGARPGETLLVPGFTGQELDLLRSIAGVGAVDAAPGDLPLSLRRSSPDGGRTSFDALAPMQREAVGYIALSPAVLTLDDVHALLGSSAGNTVELADALESVGGLISDTASGYEFVHETIRSGIVADVEGRPQLGALLKDRLSRRLARTGRAWAAFDLRRGDPEVAERLANRSLREAVFTGSTRRLVDALEYLVDRYRASGERGALLSVLLGLADTRASQGRSPEIPALLAEAHALAVELDDRTARLDVEMLQASLELRRSASQSALDRVRALGVAAHAEGRTRDAARMLLEEGIAFLGINEVTTAIPPFRRARELFEGLEDRHGVEIATRNLVVALATLPESLAESERLRATIRDGSIAGRRDRAWLNNQLVPRLRKEGRFEEAEAMAREAVAIGEELGDSYLVALNLVVLGNVLREAGRPSDAIEAYSEGGRIAQAVGRVDIEGRSSRLLALTENGLADEAAGRERREHAGRAEQYATHAAGLLAGSFAWGERALALEERADARFHLRRDKDALADCADAVADHLAAGDGAEAERLLPFLAARAETSGVANAMIARAFGSGAEGAEGSETWMRAVTAAMDRCPRAAAPRVLGVLVRGFLPSEAGPWWLHCLVRCLIRIERDGTSASPRPLGAVLLLAILGYGPHRAFTTQDLLTLGGLCLGRSARVTIRHRPDEELVLIVRSGMDDEVLLTVRSQTQHPEAMFTAFFIAAFLDAFGNDLAAILFADGLPDGAALDVNVHSRAEATESVAAFMAEAVEERPVATARIVPDEGEEVPIVIFVREDAMLALTAERNRGGELEIMLARFVEEILHATTGASVDDEIFRAKVRDLLLAVLR